MADEVDALMAIRGSLETTDGVDLVKEATELGRLYSQDSAEFNKLAGASSTTIAGPSGGQSGYKSLAGACARAVSTSSLTRDSTKHAKQQYS